MWNAQAQTYKDTVETTTFTPALTLANMLEINLFPVAFLDEKFKNSAKIAFIVIQYFFGNYS